ncbi:MAG: sortase, partial [Lachnospiraceae bacterium]|nr:sortase [Lachnospiraceae bacterium]
MYKKVLTVFIVIIAIVLIGLLVYAGYNAYINYKDRQETEAAISEFDHNARKNLELMETDEPAETPVIPVQETPASEPTASTPQSTNTPKSSSYSTYYKGYEMIGYIEIPKTNVKCAIVNSVAVNAVKSSIGVMYPENPVLNTPGNISLAGHNYRNGTYFSNNKKLKSGDVIYITNKIGTKLKYTVYSVYETTDTDASYITRNTGGAIEI